MGYKILRHKEDLISTGYMEIGSGKYIGKHWQDGFLFIEEDDFGMAEGIIRKHIPEYDHFGINEIPKHIGKLIIEDWRLAANSLSNEAIDKSSEFLNRVGAYHTDLKDELRENAKSIQEMLFELAQSCDGFYSRDEWICILGI